MKTAPTCCGAVTPSSGSALSVFAKLHFVKIVNYFDVFLTVHHSIDLFHLPSLMHNSFIP